MRFLKKTYKYSFGRVRIKSDIPLENGEITFIINTINKFMDKGYYEPCYQISREIYHNLSSQQPNSVEATQKFGKFFLTIKNS